MKKQIICCDRCGAEIPDKGARSICICTAGKKRADQMYDICRDCLDAFPGWLGEEKLADEEPEEPEEAEKEAAAVPKRGLTDEQRRAVMDLKAGGETIQGIADELGLTLSQVRDAIYYHKPKPEEK